VVGLDAACWEYLDPLLQGGRLPNLASLIGRGVCGSLQSTMPPITPVAWSSLVTGVNPGKHGVFEWVRREAESHRWTPVSARDRVGTPVWARLNEAGVRVGVINVPLTYPVQPLDGFLVCGFSTPESVRELTHPPELLAEIEAGSGAYRPTVDADPDAGDPDALYTAEREHQAQIVEIAAALSEKQGVDVLMLNLMLLDHTNHSAPGMDLVERAMVDTDADLGELLAEFSPDNVLVISDHGARRVKGVFLLGAWLADRGFLTREDRPREQRAQVLNYVLQQWLDGPSGLPERARRYLLRQVLHWLPPWLTSWVWQAIERDIPLALMQIQTLDRFVPSATDVYPVGANRGSFRLNLAGREPEGILDNEASEPTLEKLEAALRTVLDPDTGAPLFGDLHRARDLYDGPFAGDAPDLVGDYYGSDWGMVSTLPGLHSRTSTYFLESDRWYGDHSRDGIYVFAGRDFRHHSARERARLLDIPATLLYLYDVPQPEDYDGRPLTQTLTLEHALRYQQGDSRRREAADYHYSAAEEEQVLRRLSQLGYVDA
jgi:predicted AlkP superfamily phosphohydrolase/phosphomutase